jgi:hypothetical protein
MSGGAAVLAAIGAIAELGLWSGWSAWSGQATTSLVQALTVSSA